MHAHITLYYSEAIPPDVFKKPMCMHQYDMFSKCRIPCPEVDEIRHTPIADSRHVIVMRNGHVRSIVHADLPI